jgi:hypothetical protein
MLGFFLVALFLIVTLYALVLYVLKRNGPPQDWDDKYVDHMSKIVEKENGEQTR